MYENEISLSEYKGNTIFQANTLLCHSKTKFRSQNLPTVCFILTLDTSYKKGVSSMNMNLILLIQ